MKFVKLDPPGSICQNQAIIDMLSKISPQSFVEVGCGGGDLSKLLVSLGLTGVGIDYSKSAIEKARVNLAEQIKSGRYQLQYGDVGEFSQSGANFDMSISMMVMEHLEDDQAFLKSLCTLTKPGGHILLGVPSRMDRWSIEDETAGHFRRYSRQQLKELLLEQGLEDVEVWSMGVPLSNWLFGLSNYLIRKSSERDKLTLSKQEQTATSGIREIPFKTVFPPVFKLLLNKVTMSPIWLLQRAFYQTNLGLTIIARATMPKSALKADT